MPTTDNFCDDCIFNVSSMDYQVSINICSWNESDSSISELRTALHKSKYLQTICKIRRNSESLNPQWLNNDLKTLCILFFMVLAIISINIL